MNPDLFEKPKYRLVGDRGLLIEFGEGIHPEINEKVRKLSRSIKSIRPKGIIEVIPTYRSVLVVYDQDITNPQILKYFFRELEEQDQNDTATSRSVLEIPVCYGGKYGPDIETVAQTNQIDTDDVVALHSRETYQIYMIGFTPGFPFLGGLPEKLHTPRLETPRLTVPQGSVGIANNQTGIYPIESPGGWQLIGRTPLCLFDPSRSDPLLYRAGDSIKFKPITKKEFRIMAEKENN